MDWVSLVLYTALIIFFIVGVYWYLLIKDETNRFLYYGQIGCITVVAIILSVVYYPPFLLIILGIGIFIFFVFSLAKQKKEKIFEEKRTILINNENYRYIRLFVQRFMNFKDDLDEIKKLQDLLHSKNMDFSIEELRRLIKDETEAQQYDDFKIRMTYNSPESFQDFAENFLEIYGDEYSQNIHLFAKLLTEKNIKHNFYQLSAKLENVKKSIERESFEKRLFESDTLSSVESLDLLSGYEFEHFLKNLFKRMGFSVEQTKLSGDQGADLVLSKFGEKTVVQARRTYNKIGNKAIQEVMAAISHYSANKGMVVTTNYFTRQAVELANSNKIDLIDRNKLQLMMKKYL